MTNITYRIEHSFENLKELQKEWDQFVIETDSTIYMSFDWCRDWWEFYGFKKKLMITLFFINKKLSGIIPLYIEKVWFGPIWLKVARLVGSNIPPKIFDPPINENYTESIIQILLRELFTKNFCDIISLGPLSGLYKPIYTLLKVKKENSHLVSKVKKVSMGKHTTFFLPDTFENYLKSLSKNERKNRRKYELRLLKKKYTVHVDVVNEKERIKSEFKNFVHLHTTQWTKERKLGHFKAWPLAEEYNIALAKSHLKSKRLRLIRLTADNTVISYQYAFAFGDCYYWQLPARKIGLEWDRYSLGHTGLVTMIKSAIDEGIKKIEGGLGHYSYKLRLGGKEYQATTIRITANRTGSIIRSKIFYFFFFFFDRMYHIWYGRIQPYLPRPLQRPILWSWIRLNF